MAEPLADFVSILREQASQSPSRVVCHSVHLEQRRLRATPLTAFDLARRAIVAGRELERIGARRGDRVLLSVGEPHAFLIWLFGALARGLVAVPVPPVGELGASEAFVRRIRSVITDCSPQVIVVERRSRWERCAASLAGDAAMLDSDVPFSATPCDVGAELSGASPDSTAVLQYTSGSTGTPRGVVLSHANLVANCTASGAAAGFSSDDRMVSWLPLHHDMGLIGGLLVNLRWHMTTYVMTPMSFLVRPVNWLRAIHEFGATISVGPTFAYQLCVRAIDDSQMTGIDLSRWRLAFVGAEAVDPVTLQAFTDRFRGHGFGGRVFFPVYGLAEATLAVSFPPPGTDWASDSVDRSALASTGRAVPAAPGEDSVSFVSVGSALPGHCLRILSREGHEELGERHVGEIVVSGPSVSARYFHEPGDTSRTELRTGDLGYVADGRLYVVDRIKDLIIVAGQNYAAHDIETAVGDVPGIRVGRAVAFAVRGDEGTEEIWVVAELDRRTKRASREIEREVELRVLKRIGVAPRRVLLVGRGAIELTTSGKLCRSRCRERAMAEARTIGKEPEAEREAGREPNGIS